MSKWIYSQDNGGAGVVAALSQTFYGAFVGNAGTSATAETLAQVLSRSTLTASNLWCNAISITGTCTLTFRKNAGAGNQSISITTTGNKEDTTHTDGLVTGDLFNWRAVMSGSHGDACTFHCPSLLLDDSSAGVSILATNFAANGQQFDAGSAEYGAISGGLQGALAATTTETNAQIKLKVSLILSNFRINVGSAYSVSQTFLTRVNSLNGGQSVSTSTTTGSKEDATNTDSIAVGDKVCFGKSAGTGTSGLISTAQVKSAGSAMPMFASEATGVSISSTKYLSLQDKIGTSGTTESNIQVKARVADTFKNMQCNVIANSSGVATVDLRAGAASPGGGPSVAISSGTTGILEDLTGTYTTATTDLIDFRVLLPLAPA